MPSRPHDPSNRPSARPIAVKEQRPTYRPLFSRRPGFSVLPFVASLKPGRPEPENFTVPPEGETGSADSSSAEPGVRRTSRSGRSVVRYLSVTAALLGVAGGVFVASRGTWLG